MLAETPKHYPLLNMECLQWALNTRDILENPSYSNLSRQCDHSCTEDHHQRTNSCGCKKNKNYSTRRSLIEFQRVTILTNLLVLIAGPQCHRSS
jgi:hypothetical protein